MNPFRTENPLKPLGEIFERLEDCYFEPPPTRRIMGVEKLTWLPIFIESHAPPRPHMNGWPELFWPVPLIHYGETRCVRRDVTPDVEIVVPSIEFDELAMRVGTHSHPRPISRPSVPGAVNCGHGTQPRGQ